MAVEDALNVIGRQPVQLFYNNNTGGFLLLPLENRKCNISHLPIVSRGFLVAIGNWKEKHIQSIGNKKCEP
jgi:hypothetical protein